MPIISLTGYIRVAPNDLNNVLAELPTHVELTLAEDGCLKFEVNQDPNDRTVFYVSERFADEESFSNHQKRVRNSKWGEVSANVERHYKITGIES